LWNYPSLTKTYIHEKNVLLKLNESSVWPPKAWTWTQLTTLNGEFIAEHVLHSDVQPGRSQRQSANLLGDSWPTDHWQIYWSLALKTEGCGSTEWWTHWTVVTARSSYASAVLGMVLLSVRRSVCHTRALWRNLRTYCRFLIPHERVIILHRVRKKRGHDIFKYNSSILVDF